LRRQTPGATTQTQDFAGCVPHCLPAPRTAGLKGNERGRAWFRMPAIAGMRRNSGKLES
jgi:hypothetical protein